MVSYITQCMWYSRIIMSMVTLFNIIDFSHLTFHIEPSEAAAACWAICFSTYFILSWMSWKFLEQIRA